MTKKSEEAVLTYQVDVIHPGCNSDCGKELDAVKAKLEEHTKTIENFRTSFRNLEAMIVQLKERNRLR